MRDEVRKEDANNLMIRLSLMGLNFGKGDCDDRECFGYSV